MKKASLLISLILLIMAVVVFARDRAADPLFEHIRVKDSNVISSNANQYLDNNQIDGKVKIWVFFTDKGIFNKLQLKQAALEAKETYSERALQRRLKHGITELRYPDLTVRADYVQMVANLGADLRRVSKYLNAASFEVSQDKLEAIANLKFVVKIQPVALYKREIVQETPNKEQSFEKSDLEAHALSYGSSFGQLDQITVPICHDSGYTGQGVIIAVFDTGFRTDHTSFAQAWTDGRVLAEYDFVFDDGDVDNEIEDWSSAWNHGTSTWSTCGGENPGTHYGPAFDASFIVCKTEDVRSETQVEEDNWVAAVEWVDSIGADIITSSLSYSDWYTASDYDGDFATTTVSADQAAENGILVVNSAGNAGPTSPSLGAPADADSIMTIGAVNSSGTIASFSSRGPTFDGRTKPEVCAQGVSVHVASSSGISNYTFSNGTSFSCPLTAGAAGIVMSAHPSWTNMQVREALMMTADNALSPDNTYGWGIIDTWAAIGYSFGPEYLWGDVDESGEISITDAVYLVAYIFNGGPAPMPIQEIGDTDGSGAVDISDAVYLINFIFNGGPPPVEH